MTSNYIDELATRIYRAAEPDVEPDGDLLLYRIYAVLALAKGEAVTDADVHDAWAAWAATVQPGHRSLVEFHDLPGHIQQLDVPYTRAIRAVAREQCLAGEGRQGGGRAAMNGAISTPVLKLRDMSGDSTIADNDKSRQAGQRLRDMVTGIGPVTG